VQETFAEPEAPSFPTATESLPPAYSTLAEAQVTEPPQPGAAALRISAASEMRFEPQPVEWKALPLEAALCEYRLTQSHCDRPH
jgi:hypothetical protein